MSSKIRILRKYGLNYECVDRNLMVKICNATQRINIWDIRFVILIMLP